ncbi:MAG: M50 family metallopeptidase [Actinomycetota bacterium]
MASVVLGLVPNGRLVLYPFGLLATWAHELGHGLGAIVTGNRFVDLEIYRDLGGVARVAGADGIGQVIVSTAGLIGPALLGAVVMIAGSRARTAPYVLAVLAGIIGISIVFWVRNLFGVVAMLAIGAVLFLIARFGSPVVRIVAAQLVAVQLALSAWSTRDYLFIKGFERNGFQASDTQKIAEELFLPYWFWGALIGGLSIVILVWAFWVAWIRPTMEPSAS